MAFVRKKKEKPVSEDVDFKGAKNVEALFSIAEKNGLSIEPLDVVGLVRFLGLKLRFEPMKDDDSGRLKKEKEGGWCVYINSLHHPNRQRFTIAHELGHFVLHSDFSDDFEDKVFFRNGEVNPIEAQANSFAAELLMPEDQMRKYIAEVSSKVEDIASHFQVSALAVRYRAKNLGYKGHGL